MALPLAPVSLNDAIPEVGIDTEALRKFGRKMGGVFYINSLAMIKEEMEASAIEILEIARSQSAVFDNPTLGTDAKGQKGLLSAGLFHWPRPKVSKHGVIKMGFGWTRRYGRVLEFGPSVTEWMIYPKFKKWLRWFANESGFIGPTRSGMPGMRTRFSKGVRHKWSKKQLRPHLLTAVKKGRDILQKRIKKGITREFQRSLR